jgi:hypothetical protein
MATLLTAYLSEWSMHYMGGNGIDASLSDIDFTRLTHVLCTQLEPTSSSDPTLYSGWGIDDYAAGLAAIHAEIAAQGASTKLLVSIYDEPSPSHNRLMGIVDNYLATFVSNIHTFIDANSLDGCDLDWEDIASYGYYTETLIQALYAELHPHGHLVTIAGAPERLNGSLSGLNPYLDIINVMSYDMGNPAHSEYSASLASIHLWANAGFPKAKIVMGIPLYAKDSSGIVALWSEVVSELAPANSQVYEACSSIATGWPRNGEGTTHTVVGGIIWYGGMDLCIQKAAYCADEGFGGCMLFDVGQDEWFDTTQSITVKVSNRLFTGLGDHKFIAYTTAEGIPTGCDINQLTEVVYGVMQPNSSADLTLSWVTGSWVQFDTTADACHAAGISCVLQVNAPNDGNYADYNEVYSDAGVKASFIAQLSALLTAHTKCDGISFTWGCSGQGIGVSHTLADVTSFYEDLSTEISPKLISATENYGTVTMTTGAEDFLEWIGLKIYDVTPVATWYATITDISTDTSRWSAVGFSNAKLIVGINISARLELTPSTIITRKVLVETYDPTASLNSHSGYVYNGLTLIQTKAQYVVDNALGGAFLSDLLSDIHNDSRSATNAISNALLNSGGGGGSPWEPPDDATPPDPAILAEYIKRVKTPIIEVTVTRFSNGIKPSVEGLGTSYRPEVIRCETSFSFEQGVSSCTLTIKSPLDANGVPVDFYPMDRVMVRQGWNYSSTLSTTFFGFVETVQHISPPQAQQLQCKDILKLAQDNYYVQTNKRVYYSQVSTTEKTVGGADMGGQDASQRTAQAIITDLLVESGIPESRLLLRFAPYESPGAIVFGENTQVVVLYESALDAIQRMCDLVGYRIWADKTGMVRCDDTRPFAGEDYALLYTSEVDYFNYDQGFDEDTRGSLLNLECNMSDDLRNEVTVYGWDGLTPATVVGDSPYVPDPPRYKRTEVKSYILDTPELLSAAALRIYEDLNRLRYTGRATIEGDPRLEIGQTIGVYDPFVTNGETINYFLNDYSSTFESGNWVCELGFVGGIGTGSPAYSNRSPVAQIKYRVEKEDTGSTIWDIFLDGSDSFDPNGPVQSLYFVWGITGVPGVYELYGMKTSFLINQEYFNITVSLSVTDQGSPPLSSTTKITINSNGQGAATITAKQLFVASGNTIYSSPDGGKTWTSKELF